MNNPPEILAAIIAAGKAYVNQKLVSHRATSVRRVTPLIPRTTPCKYLGDANGELMDCPSCGKDREGRAKIRVKTFSCNIYGMCTVSKPIGATKCCATCVSYVAKESPPIVEQCTQTPENLSERNTPKAVVTGLTVEANVPLVTDLSMPALKGTMSQHHNTGVSPDGERVHWAYGITTCSQRFGTTLLPTIASLKLGGFTNPTLYADDCSLQQAIALQATTGLEVVPRRRHHHDQHGLAWGNYLTALYDLLLRNRNATRIVLFQDDISCPKNLIHYLSAITYPVKGYWNLYCGDNNEHLAKKQPSNGWFRSDQLGVGALAIVFNRKAVEDLLGHIVTPTRIRSAKTNWNKAIDGWVQDVLVAHQGYTEWCHNPCLVQHRGVGISTLGSPQVRGSEVYLGDEKDALELLKR